MEHFLASVKKPTRRPAARGSPRDIAVGIDASEIDYPMQSRGPLDRVAQIAERK